MSVSINKGLVLINSMSSLVRRGIQLSVMVWLHQYLLRRVSPEEYILLPIVTAITVFFPIVSSVLVSGLSRAVIVSVAQQDDDQVVRIVSSILPVLVAAAGAVLAIGTLLVIHLGDIVRIPDERLMEGQLMLGLMLLAFAYSLVMSVYQVGIHVRQQYVLANAIGLGAQLLRCLLLFGLLTLIKPGVLFVVVATAVSILAEQTALTMASRRLLRILRYKPAFFDWATAREIISFGGWISFAQVGNMIYRAADPILLNRFATPLDVAAFSIGTLIQRHLQPLVSLATQPINPVLVAMHANGNQPGLVRSFCQLCRYSIWFVGLAIVPFLLARDEFFQLYLAEQYRLYADAGDVALFILAPMILYYAVANGLDKIALATGRVQVYGILIVSTQLFNLILTLLFVGWLGLGAIGSAAATCLSWLLFITFGYVPLALHLTGIKLKAYSSEVLIPGLKPILSASIFGLVCRYYYVPSGWASLFLFYLIVSTFYIIFVIAFSIQKDERDTLKRVFTNRYKLLISYIT